MLRIAVATRGMRTMLLVAAILSLGLADAADLARAAALPQLALGNGAVVTLRGTPHIWVADEAGVLHWAGDTRALAGRSIDWASKTEVELAGLQGMARGDPWLSAGLVKVGEPIYFAKWETNESRPRLLHIQSIADVELFGINERNYGAMVLEQAQWEATFGFRVADLVKAELAPATPAAVGGVIESDDFDNPDVGRWPKFSPAPTTYERGYAGGEYFFRRVDPSSLAGHGYWAPGTYADATLAVSFRAMQDLSGTALALNCRVQGENNSQGYRANFYPNNGRAWLYRMEGSGRPFTLLGASAADYPGIAKGLSWNRVELRCVGTILTVWVNGSQVIAAQDSTFPGTGRWSLNFWPPTGVAGEGHFDNYILARP